MVHRALHLAESMRFAWWSHRVKRWGFWVMKKREKEVDSRTKCYDTKGAVVCLPCFPSAWTLCRTSWSVVCHSILFLESYVYGSKRDGTPRSAGHSAWRWWPCCPSMQVPVRHTSGLSQLQHVQLQWATLDLASVSRRHQHCLQPPLSCSRGSAALTVPPASQLCSTCAALSPRAHVNFLRPLVLVMSPVLWFLSTCFIVLISSSRFKASPFHLLLELVYSGCLFMFRMLQ